MLKKTINKQKSKATITFSKKTGIEAFQTMSNTLKAFVKINSAYRQLDQFDFLSVVNATKKIT